MYLEKGVHLKNKLNLLIQGYSGLILLLAPRSLNACYYLYDYHYNSIATWSILSWSVFFYCAKYLAVASIYLFFCAHRSAVSNTMNSVCFHLSFIV